MADTTAPTWPDGRPLVGKSLRSYLKFAARLQELGATLLEPHWLGSKKKHRAVCAQAHSCAPCPQDVISGQGVCLDCGYQQSTPPTAEAKFRAMISTLGAVVLGEYKNNRTPTSVRCLEGHDNEVLPGNVLRGQGICRVCAGQDPDMSERSFRAAVERLGGTVLGEYVNNRTPVMVKCVDGHERATRPDNVASGRGICGTCAGMIWDVFYVVTGADGVKIGITSGDPRGRLSVHRRNGHDVVVRLFEGLEGTTARDLERELIALLKAAGVPPVRGREYYPIEALHTVLPVVDDWLG